MKWSNKKIKAALEKHEKWLRDEEGGERLVCHDDGLAGASLDGARLDHASLDGARLDHASLDHASLYHASLDGARLDHASLDHASLAGARLDHASLDHASLYHASLDGARLDGASLDRASLVGASLDEKIKNKFYPLVCPESGDFVGWKKAGGYIVKLKITGDRSSSYGRKCRCSEAEVLAIENADGTPANIAEVASDRDETFIYRVGETVSVPDYDPNRWKECSTGIHFFITRQEAVDYYA